MKLQRPTPTLRIAGISSKSSLTVSEDTELAIASFEKLTGYNKYEMILFAARRGRQLYAGDEAMCLDKTHGAAVTALLEIQENKLVTDA